MGGFAEILTRTGLVVIVHDINLTTAGAAIAGALCVVHYTVAEIHIFSLYWVLPFIGIVIEIVCVALPVVSGSIEAGTAIHQMGYEIVVETGKLSSPDATISVSSLAVSWVGKTFGYCAPLHGEVVVVIVGCNLVDTPAERAMV